ncbi:MAG: rRNA maturation RNase YbeY [Oscillospiraceae bacterium]|nr:rRNA maturation RNase YbeY [Oscillospiraceae bacterium]
MLKKEKQITQELQEVVLVSFLNIKPHGEIAEFSKKVIEKCFEVEKINICVYITFTNSQEIKKINMVHRNINAETDVLSFPLFESSEIEDILKGKGFPNSMLGDIVISLNKAKQQAKEYGHSLERELGFLLVHGFYHLLGYDHVNKKDEEIMMKKQEYVLKELGLCR